MNTIIVEIAGRDSVVALLKFIDEANEREEKYNFIFTIAYVPSEYDPDTDFSIFGLGEILRLHAVRFGHKVSDMLYLAETGIWFKIVKPIFGEVKSKYITPCVACHAYCHLTRLDRAIEANADILTGERYNHDGKYKINQLPNFIKFCDEYFAKYDVKFIRPLLDVSSNDEVAEIYKNFCDEYGIEVDRYKFAGCYLENNIMVKEENKHIVEQELDTYLSVLATQLDDIFTEYKDEAKRAEEIAKKEEEEY